MSDVVLADGTRLADLIDADARRISARIHADPEIFDLELERLFAKSWLAVAHRSEFAEPGDFVTRTMGRDPVIVTLGHDDALHVLLNVCTHRGAPVCRAEAGRTRMHTCPFHGWAFSSEGALKGVPFERSVYGDVLDKDSLALRPARVDEFAGIVFATWDPDAPPLADFLGDFRWYLELLLCRTDAGLEVSGPPQRSVIDANWKIVMEGFYGDAYHVPGVHRSFADLGMIPPDDSFLWDFKATVNGHSALCADLTRHGHDGPLGTPAEVFAKSYPTGMTLELLPQLEQHLTPDQVTMLATFPPSIVTIFPTAPILFIGGGIESGALGQTMSIRFMVPVSPTRTELLSFSVVERDAPAEVKAKLHRSTAATFGVGGFFEPDDAEVWMSVQRNLEGVVARRNRLNYDAVGEPRPFDGVHPGTTFQGVSTDDNQFRFYERWLEFLEGRAW